MCPECGGAGYIVLPEHAPGCVDDCDRLGCPLPARWPCPSCAGRPATSVATGDEPF